MSAIAEIPPAPPEVPAARVCPGCGSHDFRRSRRAGIADALCACIARMPYRCRGCGRRFRLRSPEVHTQRQPGQQSGRTENRHRRRAVRQRELLLYTLALAAFAVFVFFVTGERS